MSHNIKLKQAHEMAVAAGLVAHLRAEGIPMEYPRPGNPNAHEPDALCDSSQGTMGVEVAGGYSSKRLAGDLWGFARGEVEATRRMGEVQGLFVPGGTVEDLVSVSLNKTLLEHSGKVYSVPTYLVLNASHEPLVTSLDAPRIAEALIIPQGCRFLAVYLCVSGHSSGHPEFLQLWRQGGVK